MIRPCEDCSVPIDTMRDSFERSSQGFHKPKYWHTTCPPGSRMEPTGEPVFDSDGREVGVRVRFV